MVLRARSVASLFVILACAAGCGGDDSSNGGTPDGSAPGDASHDSGRRDSSVAPPHDSGSLFPDSGSPVDANTPDMDANMPDMDANMPGMDAAMDMDAGVDAPPPVDAGPPDANVPVDAPVDSPADTNLPVDANVPIDAGVDCGTAPTLHPDDGGPASLFCPFGATGSLHCDPSIQECCIGGTLDAGGFAASVCTNHGGGCTNGNNPTEFDCESTADCTAGQVCCLMGTPTLDPVCGDWFGVGVKGTRCETGTSCAAGEFQVCENASGECTTPGTTMCTPMKTKGLQIGVCQ